MKTSLNWHHHAKKRYYRVHIQPDLFKHWSVLCMWGGIGTKLGSKKNYAFTNYQEALSFIEEVKKKRISRGYCVTI